MVGPNDGYNIFIAQKEDTEGQKIMAYFDTEINKFGMVFANTEGHNLKILKPKDAEFIIREAITQGWDPDQKGTTMVFDWKDDKLSLR